MKIYIRTTHGSATTQLRCDVIFSNRFITNFSQNVPEKTFLKSVNIWRRYGQKSVAYFFGLPCRFLADRTNGRAYATLLRPSVVCRRRLSSVTLCIVAKRCVLEQKLLLRAYRKSYMRNRLVPK